MIAQTLVTARRELHARADNALPELFDYCRNHQIDMAAARRYVGALAVLAVTVYPGQRFDFGATAENTVDAMVLEALGLDETVVDLVAWRLDAPEAPLTMFGRVGLLGHANVLDPATYIMGGALEVHESPLAWLRSGCRGCAVVIPQLAARQLRDVEGPIAAASLAHGRSLRHLIDSVSRPVVLVPERRAA